MLFIFLAPFSAELFATKPLLLKDGIEFILVGPHLEYLEDSTQKLEFEDIRKDGHKWRKSNSDNLRMGLSPSAFWLRFRIDNRSPANKEWVLHMRHSSLGYLDLYRPGPGGQYEKVETGLKRPYSQREIPFRTFVFRVPKTSEQKAGGDVYYIRVQSPGVLIFPLSLRPLDRLISLRRHERLFLGMFFGGIILMILYNLFLAVSMRDSAYAYYVGYLSFIILAAFLRSGYGQEYLKPYFGFLHQGFCFSLGYFFSALFVRKFLRLYENAPLLNKIVIATAVYNLLSVFIFFISRPLMVQLLIAHVMFSPPLYILCGIVCLRRGFKAARFYLLAWSTLLIVTALVIGSLFLPISNLALEMLSIYNFQIATTLEVLLLSLALTDKINIMRREKERAQEEALEIKETHSRELESKVDERTLELSQERSRLKESLELTQELKKQQDGDYFLTSLLINPLSRNTSNSPEVDVSFLVRQKKQFRYKKWNAELGGDINSAHSINIKGVSRTVFLNADAMGKSMQGAGGALVLGSAFHSIIERAKANPEAYWKGPEAWLKLAFQEMDRLFQSFDGGMLVSLVMGVVEDDTGWLYWLNAEHPRPVLYREGNVEFLGTAHSSSHKLGDKIQNTEPRVFTFQLHPGDIFVSGSDGRDDLIIPDLEGESFAVNSEETVFLENVRLNQGNLEGIYKSMQKQGEIIDDVSLLRLEYRGR